MKKINRVREQGEAPLNGDDRLFSCCDGLPTLYSSPLQQHLSLPNITGSRAMDHGTRTMEGVIYMSQLFEISLNCVRIVAELRQKVTTLWVSWGCRGVSWGSRKLYFLYTYVADRLELFQCSLKSATIWPESRHLTTLFFNTRPLHDTLGVVRFKSIKGLIPRVLRDRPWIFSLHDTFPDFLAQNRKKIKKTSLGIAVFIALF